MSVHFHFKDGTTEIIENATAMRPFTDGTTINDQFVEALDGGGARLGLAPILNLNCAEMGS